MSAEVERTASVNLDKNFIAAYIKNLDIYPKFFPNIVSVSKLNEKDSEWLYRVEAPLASPYNLTFVLEDKSRQAIHYCSNQKIKRGIIYTAAEY